MDNNANRVNVFCLCHGYQKMAEVTSEGIAIVSRHHGTYHTGSLSTRALLSQIAGTTDGSAIMDFVRNVITR